MVASVSYVGAITDVTVCGVFYLWAFGVAVCSVRLMHSACVVVRDRAANVGEKELSQAERAAKSTVVPGDPPLKRKRGQYTCTTCHELGHTSKT